MPISIADLEWNKHLLKYKDVYRVKKDLDSIYKIKCRKGRNIAPYSLFDRVIYTIIDNDTAHEKINLTKWLKNENIWHDVIQEGDTEASFIFREQDLEKIAQKIGIYKRRKLKPQQKAINIARLEKWRNSRQDVENADKH